MTKQRFSLLLLSLPLVLNSWGQTAGPSPEAAQAGAAPPGCPMTLDSLFAIADRNSQQLRISMTGAASSGEALKAAKSNMLPDVNLSLSGSYIGTATVLSRGFSSSGQTTVPYAIGVGQVQNGPQPTPHWGTDFVAQVSQVIYAGGGIKAGIRMAELSEQMALLDVEKNRQEVRFLIVGHYLELCKLSNEREVVAGNIELTEQLLTTMRARQEQGMMLKTDITRYELQLQSLRLSEIQLRDAMSIMNHRIVTLLHLPEATEIVPAQALSVVDGMEHQQWQDIASSQNIAIQQARLASEISEAEVKAVRAKQLPSVALIAEDHLGGPYVNDLIPVNANINAWFVGIGIKYDLGSLWRGNHDVRRAHLNARQSIEKVALAREGINQAVQADYTNWRTSYVEVETQRKQVELATQHYDVTQNRYNNGLALLTDMLDASNMKLSADMHLVNAQINLIYNYYKLKFDTSSL